MNSRIETMIEIYVREINESYKSNDWSRLQTFSESLAKYLERESGVS